MRRERVFRGIPFLLCLAGTAALAAPSDSGADIIKVQGRAAADSVGRLRVAIRTLTRPTEPLSHAVAILLDSGFKTVAHANTGDVGSVTFPVIPVGRYWLRMARLGYQALDVGVNITAFCGTEVEAYLVTSIISFTEVVTPSGPPPPPRPVRVSGARATITHCETDLGDNPR